MTHLLCYHLGSLSTIQGPRLTPYRRLKISAGEAQKSTNGTSSPGDSYGHWRLGVLPGVLGESVGQHFSQSAVDAFSRVWLPGCRAAGLLVQREAEATGSITIIGDVVVLPSVPHNSVMLNCYRLPLHHQHCYSLQLRIQRKMISNSWKVNMSNSFAAFSTRLYCAGFPKCNIPRCSL